MATIPGKFIWFEHVSTDTAEARAFYGELLGWSVQEVPMGGQPYPMLHNGATPVGGLRGDGSGGAAHWLTWMSVDDVDAKAAACEGAGAKVVQAPTDFPGAGRGAVLQDPLGATFGIWRSAAGEDMPDPDRPQVGDWCWNELTTSDVGKAVAFYEQVFRYEHDELAMPDGPYYVLKSGGVPRAGVMKPAQSAAPPQWMPYVEVGDADATVAKSRGLGAKLLLEPQDVPDVGRVAILQDPQAAPFGIIRSVQQG